MNENTPSNQEEAEGAQKPNRLFSTPAASHMKNEAGQSKEPLSFFSRPAHVDEDLKAADGFLFNLGINTTPGEMTDAQHQAFSMAVAAHVDVLKRIVTELDLRDQDLLNAINNLNRVSQTLQTWQTRHVTTQMVVLNEFKKRLDASEAKCLHLEEQLKLIVDAVGIQNAPLKPHGEETKSSPSSPPSV